MLITASWQIRGYPHGSIANSARKDVTCQDKDGNEDDEDVTMDNGGYTEGMPCEVTTLNGRWHWRLVWECKGQRRPHSEK